MIGRTFGPLGKDYARLRLQPTSRLPGYPPRSFQRILTLIIMVTIAAIITSTVVIGFAIGTIIASTVSGAGKS